MTAAAFVVAGGALLAGASGRQVRSAPPAGQPDDRQVGTVLYRGVAVPPAQSQRRDDMKLYLLGIERNDDRSPAYRFRVYTETAVYKNTASFQWAWCNWSGFMTNTVSGPPDPGTPDDAGRLDINADGTFHASIGGNLGRCTNTRIFDPDDLIFGEEFTGKWVKSGDTYVLRGKWVFAPNPSVSIVYDITLPAPGSTTVAGCRYPKARKLTLEEIRTLPEELRDAAAEANELHVTSDPLDRVMAAFKACGYRVKNRMDLPFGTAVELQGLEDIGIVWWKSTGQTYIAYQ
jgi:hypothetical protein